MCIYAYKKINPNKLVQSNLYIYIHLFPRSPFCIAFYASFGKYICTFLFYCTLHFYRYRVSRTYTISTFLAVLHLYKNISLLFILRLMHTYIYI